MGKADNTSRYHEGQDPLFDHFKNELEDLSTPVDAQCWKNIQQQLTPPVASPILAPTPRFRKRYLWTAVAAASIALLFALVQLLPSSSNNYPSMADQTVSGDTLPKRVTTTISSTPIIAQSIAMATPATTPRTNTATTHTPVNRSMLRELHTTPKSADTHQTTEKSATHLAPGSAVKQKTSTPVTKTEQAKEATSSASPTASETYLPPAHYSSTREVIKRKSRRWSLAAAFTSYGSNTSKQTNFASNLMASPTMATTPLEKNAVLLSNPTEISELTYAIPFSVGILVSKQLNHRFSIATGISYSRLRTSYTDATNEYFSVRSTLHYLGIPLHLTYRIWSLSDKWKIYASAGGRIEKGISWKQSRFNYSNQETLQESNSVKGLQWSVDLSIGLSCKVYKQLHLYVEPRLSYYFDNNQPISIRTEHPTVMGLNTGLRFDF
ncbi:MAG: porin family protein [Bacteroidaceae bacterium]